MARRWALSVVALVVVVMLVTAGTCARDIEPAPTDVPRAETVSIDAGEDVVLDARLFNSHTERVVIFLHAFDGSQTDWWPLAEEIVARGWASALTFDFRGYGASTGRFAPEDLVSDVEAAVAFARLRGFDSIVLVGASMGGTAAIVAAAEDPNIEGVIGVSAPVSFGQLEAADALEARAPQMALLAGRGDVSAADSARQMSEIAGLGETRVRLFPDVAAHGTALFTSKAGPEARAYFFERLEEMWQWPHPGAARLPLCALAERAGS